MPRFAYRAVGKAGNVIEGEREAADRPALVTFLQGEGYVPIRAVEQRNRPRITWLSRKSGKAIASAERVVLVRELAMLLRAGLSLERALVLLGEVSASQPIRRFLARALEHLRAGQSLASSFGAAGDDFPEYALGLLRAGDAGGNLEDVLDRLAESLERERALKDQVRSALQYPLLVLIIAGLSIAVLVAWVIPSFQPLFANAGDELPSLTKVVIAGADFLRNYWWILLLLTGIGAIGFSEWCKTAKGRVKWDAVQLQIPLIGTIVSKVETARATRTLGTLLTNGVPALEALAVTARATRNKTFALALEQLRTKTSKGKGLAGPIAEAGVFPPLAKQLIAVGEESGKLETMLLQIAEIFEDETRRSIHRLLALLVPAITIALGLVVALIIGAMLLAVLSSYDLPF